MEERLNCTENNIGIRYCDMVKYHEWDSTSENKAGRFDDWNYNRAYKLDEIAEYLEKNGFELESYRDEDSAYEDYLRLDEDIRVNSNDIIIDVELIAEEKKALLTFFDKSTQLVDIKNLKWDFE